MPPPPKQRQRPPRLWSDLPRRLLTVSLGAPLVVAVLSRPATSRLDTTVSRLPIMQSELTSFVNSFGVGGVAPVGRGGRNNGASVRRRRSDSCSVAAGVTASDDGESPFGDESLEASASVGTRASALSMALGGRRKKTEACVSPSTEVPESRSVDIFSAITGGAVGDEYE